MRVAFLLLVPAFAFAKVTINPGSQNAVPGQCVSFRAHFSEATKGGKVRDIVLSSEQKSLGVFATPDCSGSFAATIPGDRQDFNFSVQPNAQATGKIGLRLAIPSLNEMATASINIVQ